MKVYVTKYALTGGIETHEAELVGDEMIVVRKKGAYFDQYFHKKEWHTTATDAISRAEEMRQAKLKSLDKQKSKLEKIKFTITE